MFDFTPLYRSSVGFDHLARMLDDAASFETPAYPPYNIERVGEDEYRITIAIAGFCAADINLEVKGNALTVPAKRLKSLPKRPSICTRELPGAILSAVSSLPITSK